VERLDDRLDEQAGQDRRGEERAERRWSDEALLDAMRRNDAGAFREFFERFSPLLAALAGSCGIGTDRRDEVVTEFLDDVAMHLALASTAVPRSVASYLATSFRNRAKKVARALRVSEALPSAYLVDGGGSERIVATLASEDAVRASHGPDWDGPGLSVAIERLALELERGLDAEERQLLALLGERVPQREIAEWLGTTHGALRVRVTRLRARLADAAVRYAWRLEGAERAALDRFFARIAIPVSRPLTRVMVPAPGGGRGPQARSRKR
jgi:DNA-directed RNA polymerase specialized sigma24 family protein